MTRREQAMRPGPMLAIGRTMIQGGWASRDYGLIAAGRELEARANAALDARPNCSENDHSSNSRYRSAGVIIGEIQTGARHARDRKSNSCDPLAAGGRFQIGAAAFSLARFCFAHSRCAAFRAAFCLSTAPIAALSTSTGLSTGLSTECRRVDSLSTGCVDVFPGTGRSNVTRSSSSQTFSTLGWRVSRRTSSISRKALNLVHGL